MLLKHLCPIKDGLPVSDSCGNQVIVGILSDDYEQIVCIVDKLTRSYFIERVVNKFAIDLWASANFSVITNEEEWKAYAAFFWQNGLDIVLGHHYGKG